MEKMQYIVPEVEIIKFNATEEILLSGGNGGKDELPDDDF